MKSRTSGSVVPWLLLAGWGLGALGSGSLGFGCASQSSTAQALAIAGTAAVIVGASLAADNDCAEAVEGSGAAGFCSSGVSKSTRRAGTAVAVAGAGVAAAGYALQPKGPDGLHPLGPAPSPRAPTQPYRLIRKPAPEPAPTEPEAVSPESVSPEAVSPEAAPEVPPETTAEPPPASNAPAR